MVGFGSSNIPSEPLTNDIAATEFSQKAGLTIEVEQQLRTLDMPVRLKVLTVLDAKMIQHPVQNPSMYLAGIIRNENRAGPYKAFGATAQAVPEPFQGTVNAQQLRAMPSPQHSPHVHTKPPPWVSEVFVLAMRPSLFLKRMMDALGAENMSLIRHHPAVVQVSLLMTLLVSPSAWVDPQGSFKSLLNHCQNHFRVVLLRSRLSQLFVRRVHVASNERRGYVY